MMFYSCRNKKERIARQAVQVDEVAAVEHAIGAALQQKDHAVASAEQRFG